MTEILAALFLIVVLAGVLALLEHTARRTAGLPRLPFGADADRDADLPRLLHDLDADRAHMA